MVERIRKLSVFIVIAFLLALTSCSLNPPPGDDTAGSPAAPAEASSTAAAEPVSPMDAPAPTETSDAAARSAILYYSNCGNFQEPIDDAVSHDTVSADFTDENQKESFIRSYLQEHGVPANSPDGVTYAQGKPYTEYYTDESGGEMCFVFHGYFETAAGAAIERITCTALYLADFSQIGELACGSDPQQGTGYESLYDTAGNQTAYIAYRPAPGAPFPLITKYWGGSNDVNPVTDVLYRSQRFWIYYDNAEFDESGKWISSDEDIFGGGFPPGPPGDYLFDCSYDAEGRLQKVGGVTLPIGCYGTYNEFPTDITISYQENGEPGIVNYNRDETVYSTTLSSGEIHYDAAGRMVYESAYITSGGQYYYYVYKGDERQPWICVRFNYMGYGLEEKDGVEYYYGNPLTVYMFRPD